MDTETTMTNPRLPEIVQRWRRQVDDIMRRDFMIDLDGAGASDEEVLRYFEFGFSPREFTDWFGKKYDLDYVTDR